MLAPILPRPTIPIFIGCSLLVGTDSLVEILPRPGPGVVADVDQHRVDQAGIGQAKVGRDRVGQDSELALSVRIWRSSSKDLANEWTPSSSSVVDDVGEVDAGVGQPGQPATPRRPDRRRPSGRRCRGRERVDRLGRHRVDRVRADERVDVQKVRVGRVLGGGRRPQRALDLGTLGRQRLPAGAGERWPKCWYASWAWATAAWPRRARIAWSPPLGPASCSSRRSTSVSTRLTKNDATLCTFDRSVAPDAA